MNLKILKVKTEILLRKFAEKFNIDLKMTDEEGFIKLLQHKNIDLILDVGANTGQYAQSLIGLGYKGNIVSFEPLTSAYETLVHKTKKYLNWKAAGKIGLGDFDGEAEINISKNSVSSSILNMSDEHIEASPDALYVDKETIKVRKLDSVFYEYKNNFKNIFLKIDAQGYEENILNGALKSLSEIKGLQLELSLVQLYDGQKLFMEMVELIGSYGFNIYSMQQGFTNKNTGRVLQSDVVFFR